MYKSDHCIGKQSPLEHKTTAVTNDHDFRSRSRTLIEIQSQIIDRMRGISLKRDFPRGMDVNYSLFTPFFFHLRAFSFNDFDLRL